MKLQETPPELCAVCLSEFAVDENVRDLKCKHVFHKLDKWLLQCRSTCPLRRTKLLPDEVVAGYRLLKDDQMGYDRNNEEIVFLVSHGNDREYLARVFHYYAYWFCVDGLPCGLVLF
ncbi:uncharacterized protein LOC131181424 [Hevea brasiliensis]|uniref:uncharacterized protein LOC131181424 n=1 Tax=Hevea brasiliensis TaxID=3981 RepID=UPI0025DC41BA|nr:uncharacterized protein LOC131181424 [Hevea brasiliensis]